MQQSLIFALRCYQRVVSPMLMGLFGPLGRCRFEPSCSQYAIEAVRVHGAIKGALLAVWRLCRCHPWGGCGVDQVPKKFKVQSLRFKVGEKVDGCACGEGHVTEGQG
ncbi:MAG TPA: membrane protein insertion efficiency factor YidD [Verrucomicrobiae bacterium]|nr:membrane protein insertion efficiency factor YidD [Verrucomicrobiae bacterium]